MHSAYDTPVAMTLEQYMEKKGIKDAEFAERIGKDRSLVSRYRRGEVIPSLDVIARIEAATAKAVSFRDFLASS